MAVQINYKKSLVKRNTANLVLFVDEKFSISGIKKYVSSSEFSFISDLLKTKDTKKQILIFDISSKKKVILVNLKSISTNSDAERIGAKFYDILKDVKQSEYSLNTDTIPLKLKNLVGYFLHGLKLKSYIFEKYKNKKSKIKINISVSGKNKPSLKEH